NNNNNNNNSEDNINNDMNGTMTKSLSLQRLLHHQHGRGAMTAMSANANMKEKEKIKCPFHKCGCMYVASAVDVETHVQADIIRHSEMQLSWTEVMISTPAYIYVTGFHVIGDNQKDFKTELVGLNGVYRREPCIIYQHTVYRKRHKDDYFIRWHPNFKWVFVKAQPNKNSPSKPLDTGTFSSSVLLSTTLPSSSLQNTNSFESEFTILAGCNLAVLAKQFWGGTRQSQTHTNKQTMSYMLNYFLCSRIIICSSNHFNKNMQKVWRYTDDVNNEKNIIHDKVSLQGFDDFYLFRKLNLLEAPNLLKVSGRKGINTQMNGVYQKQSSLHCGRAWYRKQDNELSKDDSTHDEPQQKVNSSHLSKGSFHDDTETTKHTIGTANEYGYEQKDFNKDDDNTEQEKETDLKINIDSNDDHQKVQKNEWVIRYHSESEQWLFDKRGLRNDDVANVLGKGDVMNPLQIEHWEVHDGSKFVWDNLIVLQPLLQNWESCLKE
ncbi:hypothetical protein RFI_04454, partial [Reticulomyxa filosa]